MKCNFCGKLLDEGAEFCPGCGTILSLGGVSEEPEIKDEPNVFRAMNIEQEPSVPAMELETVDTEEIAVVVEGVPEYVEEQPEAENTAEAEEEKEQAEEEDELAVPEYDPNAKVSDEFMNQLSEEAETEEEEEPEEQAEEAQEAQAEDVSAEDELAAPEYEGDITVPEYEGDAEVEVQQDAYEDISSGSSQEDAYPVYNEEAEQSVPEEKFTEDESLFAALFVDAESEEIEDITPVAADNAKNSAKVKSPKKASKEPARTKNGKAVPAKGSKMRTVIFAVLLLVVLVAAVFATDLWTSISKPGIDPTSSTSSEPSQQADATVKPSDKTTTKAPEKTTEPSTEKATTDKATTTTEPTTETTSEKETTTKAPEKTTEPTTESTGINIVEPSSYNFDETAFFPISGDISIKAGPAASSADVIMHPYGYPVYAYAKEGSYYYVDSPILDLMGWVNEDDLERYVEEPAVDATTEAPVTEEAPAGDSDVSYTAVINSDEGLNFRTGPGADYEIKYTVPGGYRVRVSKQSAENPGWVYVTIEDSRYPYGSPSGWVSAEFLS